MYHNMKQYLLSIFVLLGTLAPDFVKAQRYSYDTVSFNPAHLRNMFTTNNAECMSVAVQSDGKLVVALVEATVPRFCVARLLPNGSPDPSFGTGGMVYIGFGTGTNAQAKVVKVHPNTGAIFVAGKVDSTSPMFGVAKLNSNGTLNNTFGSGNGLALYDLDNNSSVNEDPNDMIIDGNLVYVAGNVGYDRIGIVCFDASDGSLNIGFGSDGIRIILANNFYTGGLTAECNSMLLIGDNLYVVGRWNDNTKYKIAVAAINKFNGNFYSGFNSGSPYVGYDIDPSSQYYFHVNDAKLDPKGRLAVTGTRSDGSTTESFIYYIKTTGTSPTQDSSIFNIASAITILPDHYGAVVFSAYDLYRVEGKRWESFIDLPTNFTPRNSFIFGGKIYCYGVSNDKPVIYRFNILKQLDIDFKGPDVVTQLSIHSYAIHNGRGYYNYTWSIIGSNVDMQDIGLNNMRYVTFKNNAPENIIIRCAIDSAGYILNTLVKNVRVIPLQILGPKELYSGSAHMYNININQNYLYSYTFSWSYSGSGVVIDGRLGPTPFLNFSEASTSGVLTVTLTHSQIPQPAVLSLPITVSAYNPIPHSIIGRVKVGRKRMESYSVIPNDIRLYYLWKYQPNVNNSGNAVNVVVDKGPKASVYFPENAPSGTLICYVFKSELGFYPDLFDELSNTPDIGPIDTLFLPLTLIDAKDDLSALLESPLCEVQLINCDDLYINEFEISSTNIKNINSGCIPGGYSDFIGPDFSDTLYLGEVYKIKLKAGGTQSANAYYGIWLDYDNDGNFNQPHEMLAYSTLSDSMYITDYIVLKNKSEYNGNVARLRVRVRKDSPFAPSEFCPKANDLGETEDYMVILIQRENLEA
ncbi:MAG: delta-60 repeat domain-containing protein, partial [Cytophagaceae bacterium]|nr:delta-60 repeat domain-containing protein [Cytophagaceae bacterium]MDW8457363.1 delta-60 repeat domain-containing protein [Cytophagaceae bacterium]